MTQASADKVKTYRQPGRLTMFIFSMSHFLRGHRIRERSHLIEKDIEHTRGL